jgi:lipoprotein-anchoring transpeptidase ErfK/SrfK
MPLAHFPKQAILVDWRFMFFSQSSRKPFLRPLRTFRTGLGIIAAIGFLPFAAPAVASTASPLDSVDQGQVAADLGSQAQLDAVAQRLKDSLTPEMLTNFRLFLYVNKAESGPSAQRMYVFEKTEDGELSPLYAWPVSTGRERVEIDPHGHVETSVTPLGYFELDPQRQFVDHASSQWNEAMPYAMFFNWKPNGHNTGLAIHGTPDENADALGTPASAGCVRLSLENARRLFSLVRSQFRGPAPELAYLDGDEGVSSEGLLLHDPRGRLLMADGYSVLVVIDDDRGEDRVTSLY